MYTIKNLDNSLAGCAYQSFTFPLYSSYLKLLKPEGLVVAIAASGKDREPLGLALAEISENRSAKLLSLLVKPTVRCQGIGTALLTYLEKELSLRGCTKVEIVYVTGQKTTKALEHLLQKFNWTLPKPRSLVCKTTIDRVANAHWMKLSKLPSSYEIFPWQEITQKERLVLQQEQLEKPWIALDANPFENEKNLEPINSLGLRYKGKVVGWTISHRIASDTIRYTCGYLRPDLQKMGRFIPLIVKAVQLQTEAKIPRGTWTVALAYHSYIDFIKKHMQPYLISLEQSRDSSKLLSASKSK